MGRHRAEPLPERKPSWLKVKAPGGPNYARLRHLMRELDLHTVCEEAHCPNVGECWEHGTATFMILGDVCTRNCGYCAVTHGRPPKYDLSEPSRVAAAIARDAAAARGHHLGRPRRSARLRRVHLRRDDPADPRAGARLFRRGARSGLPGQRREHSHGAGCPPGDLQPQHRDRAAAVQARASRRSVRARDEDLSRCEVVSRPTFRPRPASSSDSARRSRKS